VDSIKHINQAKKALKRAFDVQLHNQGFGFVEFLSACPTNWRMTPLQANQRVGNELTEYFPLGTFKDCEHETEKS
jgi:2-oxoglutarate ferredoxin oxidoreductase subunit beta